MSEIEQKPEAELTPKTEIKPKPKKKGGCPPKGTKRLNALNLLPLHIRVEINSLIDKGAGNKDVLRVINDRYTGDMESVRSLWTIKEYIKEYKAGKTTQPPTQASVLGPNNQNSELPTLNADEIFGAKNIDLTNKKAALEYLGKWCNARAMRLSNVSDLDSRGEATLVKYFSEMREVIETMSKLSGELSENDDKQIVIKYVNENIYSILSIVAKTVREVYESEKVKVCPHCGKDVPIEEKILIFKEKLKENFSTQGSDIHISGNADIIDIKKVPEETVIEYAKKDISDTTTGGTYEEPKTKPKEEEIKSNTTTTEESATKQ